MSRVRVRVDRYISETTFISGGLFGRRSSRRDKNARRGAERYRYKSICMWNDTCRHGRGVECELQQVNGTHNGNCACENRIVDEKGATK